MSALISIATGNFTAAGTWALVDPTSLLDSQVGNSLASSVAFSYSSTFTPGAITVDGVAVNIWVGVASPSGTVTLELYNHTGTVAVTSVTINSADIGTVASSGTYYRGWYLFKFSAPQTLLAATLYKIGLKTSVSNQMTFFSDVTVGNWSRMLRTTTTQAPAVDDALHVIGEWTAAGTLTSFVVTMNNTATTSFGPTVGVITVGAITVGRGGTMSCGVATTTNYYLKWKGVLVVADGGTLNIGTSGSPIPSSSTAVFEFDAVANVDSGIIVSSGGTFNVWGATKTNFWTFLSVDKAAAATTIVVDDTTGWATSDDIVIAATSRVAGDSEKRTILTVDSSVQVTVTAGLTNAHSGTAPTRGEVINLTRNVKIRGISQSLGGYIYIYPTAAVTLRYAEFYFMGSATALKRGIDVTTTTGTFNIQYCSLHDFLDTASAIGLNVTSGSGTGIVCSNNCFYRFYVTAISSASNNNSQTYSNCIAILTSFVGATASVGVFTFGDASSVYSNLTVVSCTNSSNTNGCGILISENAILGTCSNITVHSCTSFGFYIFAQGGTVAGLIVWRTYSPATVQGGGIMIQSTGITITDVVAFGNGHCNVMFVLGAFVYMSNLLLAGDTTYSTAKGIAFGPSSNNLTMIGPVGISNAVMGQVTGIYAAHTTADLIVNNSVTACWVSCNSCLFASSVELSPIATNGINANWIFSQKHDQIAGNHKTFCLEGSLITDTVIYRTASPSMRMSPISANGRKLYQGPPGHGFKKRVANGSTAAFSVWVRKSVVGDGAAYAGSQPRLLLRQNSAAGITADTVLATAAAAAGTWEQLTGTTAAVTDDAVLEFIIDNVSGVAGWVNVDDAS